MYLNCINIDVDTRYTIQQYLSLISQRASGTIGAALTQAHAHHSCEHHTHNYSFMFIVHMHTTSTHFPSTLKRSSYRLAARLSCKELHC